MEVVPTGDGDDDGVVWFRCPQCQGFLPKLSSAGPLVEVGPRENGDSPPDGADRTAGSAAHDVPGEDLSELGVGDPVLEGDIDDVDDVDDADDDDDDDDDGNGDADEPGGGFARGRTRGRDRDAPAGPAEPVHEYAAMLAAVDPVTAVPYRPWDAYEVGQCVLHLAWDDCGVVVAKEVLPGGRQVIKCWFQGAGVVRLIENAPR